MVLTETRTYDSSNIRESMYNFNTKELTLIFTGGKQYKYLNVNEDSYRQFSTADSVGREFIKIIKNKFEFKLIN